jgi:hypothetical protein
MLPLTLPVDDALPGQHPDTDAFGVWLYGQRRPA